MDRDAALRADNGRVDPLGLCELDRNIGPVGRAYRQLIHDRCTAPPVYSVPVAPPSEQGRPQLRRQQAIMRDDGRWARRPNRDGA